MKKTISMLLSALLILSLFQIGVMSASADTAYSFNALQFDSSNLETTVSSPYYGRCNVANPNNSTVYENFIFNDDLSFQQNNLFENDGKLQYFYDLDSKGIVFNRRVRYC